MPLSTSTGLNRFWIDSTVCCSQFQGKYPDVVRAEGPAVYVWVSARSISHQQTTSVCLKLAMPALRTSVCAAVARLTVKPSLLSRCSVGWVNPGTPNRAPGGSDCGALA